MIDREKYDLIEVFGKNVESEGGQFNLTEYEIEKLKDAVRRMDTYEANVGNEEFVKRIEFNPREKAFHEQWLKQNKPEIGINQGNGTLQNLFIKQTGLFNGSYATHIVTDKERMVTATAIQWLGTNCGMCFLEETLAKFGKKIVDK